MGSSTCIFERQWPCQVCIRDGLPSIGCLADRVKARRHYSSFGAITCTALCHGALQNSSEGSYCYGEPLWPWRQRHVERGQGSGRATQGLSGAYVWKLSRCFANSSVLVPIVAYNPSLSFFRLQNAILDLPH